MEAPRKFLIITADDFGFCPDKDDSIVELLTQQCVTSTTLVVNGDDAQNAFTRAQALKFSVGLQLNLSQGKPLSPVEKVSSLLNSDNEFRGQLGFLDALAAGEIEQEHLEMEIEAQIRWILSRGGKITHLSGHMYCHIRSPVVEILIPIMQKYEISKVRIPEESNTELASIIDIKNRHFLTLISRDAVKARQIFASAGIISTSRFEGNSLMGWSSTLERAKSIFSRMIDGDVIEWMCHPGKPSKSVCDQFHRSKERWQEFENLQDSRLHEWFRENGFKLICWQDLTAELLKGARAPEGAVGIKSHPETDKDPHRNSMKGHKANREADLAAMNTPENPVAVKAKAALAAVEEGVQEIYHSVLAKGKSEEEIVESPRKRVRSQIQIKKST